MRVLIACEFSGRVRDAFIARGHDAVSCDLLPSETPGPHIQGDALAAVASRDWDLLIAHPPCQYLANSGVRWLYGGKGNRIDPERWAKMEAAADFFWRLLNAPVPRVAVENPIMHGFGRDRINGEPTQTIQPWMFNHPEQKATQLWLRNLPPLRPVSDLRPQMATMREADRSRVHYASPGPERWKERSRTLPGVAAQMAEQWGAL